MTVAVGDIRWDKDEKIYYFAIRPRTGRVGLTGEETQQCVNLPRTPSVLHPFPRVPPPWSGIISSHPWGYR